MKFKHGIQFHLLLLGIVPASLMTVTLIAYDIHTRVNDLEFAEWGILRDKILITLFGLFAIGSLVYKMGRKVSEPILELTKAVRAVSEGNFDARADFAAEAEFGALKAGFNAMAEELRKSHGTLQSQIEIATAKLQETLKSLEEKNLRLEHARKLADAQNEIKSQFLAHMSHEIRTPMNGVVGFTELLARTPLTMEQREQVELIDRSAKNLLAIINDILDLSTLESGKFNLNIKEFELRPCIEDAIALLTPHAKSVRIIQSIDRRIPVTIQGDPLRISQVITNLLGNALKFTRQGRIIVRVRSYCRSGRNLILFSVSDTGCGIVEADRGNLFSPFLQLSDFAIEQERGTGLGLAISKNIVERMNGRINVVSRQGVGSTFWFTLPVDKFRERHDWITRFRGALIEACPISRKALEHQLHFIGGEILSYARIEDLLHAPTDEIRRYDFIFIANFSGNAIDSASFTGQLAALRGRFYAALILLQQENQRDPLWQPPPEIAARIPLPCRCDLLRRTLQTISQRPAGGNANRLSTPSGMERNTTYRFLIADDNEINRLLLKTQLSKREAGIQEARDGREALDMIQEFRFDMIFLDLQMPHTNGMEVARKLKNSKNPNRDTPVVAITAHAQREQRQTILAAGFDECLIKPILSDQLDDMIGRHLVKRGTLRPNRRARPQTQASPYLAMMLLRTEGNRDLARTLFYTLFTELPEQIQEIEQALMRSDFNTARSLAHQLHGSASFCGFMEIKQIAHDFESALLMKQHQLLPSLFQSLKREANSFLDNKEKILDAL